MYSTKLCTNYYFYRNNEMMFLYFKFYFILSVSLPFDTFDLYQGISIISVKEIDDISYTLHCII